MRPNVVILDGVDGVGKSSVRILLSQWDPNLFIIERFTPSIYAYGIFYNRNLDIKKLIQLEGALEKSFTIYPIYLYCGNPKILWKRYCQGRHVLTLDKKDLIYLMDLMDEYIKKYSYYQWKKINTSIKKPNEIFQIIKDMLEVEK